MVNNIKKRLSVFLIVLFLLAFAAVECVMPLSSALATADDIDESQGEVSDGADGNGDNISDDENDVLDVPQDDLNDDGNGNVNDDTDNTNDTDTSDDMNADVDTDGDNTTDSDSTDNASGDNGNDYDDDDFSNTPSGDFAPMVGGANPIDDTETDNTATLTISVGDNNLDSEQVFLYRIIHYDEFDDEGENVRELDFDMLVAAKNGEVKVSGLEVGLTYEITEVTEWSWRYSPTTENGTQTVTIQSGENSIAFTHTVKAEKWLNGFDCVDIFKKEEEEGSEND